MFAFADPAWPVRYLTAGVLLLIPVVGYLALLGWQARIYETARLGRRLLPHIEIKRDVTAGLPIFINILLLLVLPVLLVLFVTLPLDAVGVPHLRYPDTTVIQFLFFLYLVLTYPEVLRRSLADGEWLVPLKPLPSLRAITQAPEGFAITVAGTLSAYMVGAMGIYAFLIGVLFTAPIGHAVAAHLAMQWQRDVNAQSKRL